MVVKQRTRMKENRMVQDKEIIERLHRKITV